MESIDFKEDLIQACKNRDRRAQKELYHTYADAMYNVAYRLVNNDEDARDVLQQAFIDVFRSLEHYKFKSTPGAWIKRIVINRSLTFIKKKNKVQIVEFEDYHEETADGELDSYENFQVEEVKRAIADLPEGYRTVLNLYLVEGYDHKEIGEILSVSEATSKSQYSRAKKKLRRLLEK